MKSGLVECLEMFTIHFASDPSFIALPVPLSWVVKVKAVSFYAHPPVLNWLRRAVHTAAIFGFQNGTGLIRDNPVNPLDLGNLDLLLSCWLMVWTRFFKSKKGGAALEEL